MMLAVVAIPGAIHLTMGNLVAPRLMGRGLELHPVTVLLALAFWGLLWGIVGMVLAVPIVATAADRAEPIQHDAAAGRIAGGPFAGDGQRPCQTDTRPLQTVEIARNLAARIFTY